MKLLHLSDTHGLHRKLQNLPPADIIIHTGDISNSGTEAEVLDFLNWYIDLPYSHKIFVAGNHDLCLWDATGIEDLPANLHFLQDSSITIGDLKFFGLGYDHSEQQIPSDTDILITHEPPLMILDESSGIHWGNANLRTRVLDICPRYHLFGHAHDAYGIFRQSGILFSNAALLTDTLQMTRFPRLLTI